MENRQSSFLKKIDILLLILFPIVATITSLYFSVNFLVATLLFFGVGSVYLSFRTPHRVSRTLLFSVIFSIPMGFLIDYLALINNAWYVPHTVFPHRLLGVVPYEDMIWGFLLVYHVVIFYEHFLDKGKHNLIDKKMKYFIWPVILVFLIFFLSIYNDVSLILPYPYLIICSIFVLLPSVTFLAFFPRLISKYIKTTSYFFMSGLMFELTGLHLNHWGFAKDGQYVGWIELLGHRFPLEEFFFWFVMIAIGILSYYEFFDDDRK